MTLEDELIAAKKELDAAKKKYDALAAKAKKEHGDGIVPVGIMALVLFTSRHMDPVLFENAYPYEKYSHLYKEVPDTEAVRKELSAAEFTDISNPRRTLTVKTLKKALADLEEFGEKG